MKRFLKWLWYQRQEHPVEPMLLDLPATYGTLRFVFSNVDTAPQVIVWCSDNTVVSCGPVEVEAKEVQLELRAPAKALSVVGVPNEALLEQIYAGSLVMMRGPILAAPFDVMRKVTYFVPRWRLVKKWVIRLGLRLRYRRRYHEII